MGTFIHSSTCACRDLRFNSLPLLHRVNHLSLPLLFLVCLPLLFPLFLTSLIKFSFLGGSTVRDKEEFQFEFGGEYFARKLGCYPFGSSVFLKASSDFTKSSTLFIIFVTVFGTWLEKRLASSGHFELLMNDDICMTIGTSVQKSGLKDDANLLKQFPAPVTFRFSEAPSSHLSRYGTYTQGSNMR
ncbi:hypothetical protein Tco_0426255 [Tanacetum coccineum]